MNDSITITIGCRCGKPNCQDVLQLRREQGHDSVSLHALSEGVEVEVVLDLEAMTMLRGASESFKTDLRALAEAATEDI